MPNNTIVTMYLKHLNTSEGWRESIPTSNSPAGAFLQLPALCAARATCLSFDCQIYAYRAANQGPPKAGSVIKLQTPYQGSMVSALGVEEPGDCLIYRLNDNAGHSRQLALRGVPGNCISQQKLSTVGITLLPIWTAFVGTLLNNVYGFNAPYTSSPKVTIASIISPSVGGLAVVTTTTSHGLAPGNVVQIRRMKDFPLANAQWKVGLVGSSTTFTLLGSEKFAFNTTWPGYVQLVNPQFFVYGAQTFNEVSWRKTGKPSFTPRGKSSTRVVHR